MSFGARLQAARERAGLTQRVVADALSVTTQAISLWERDKNSPEAFRIMALARLYKVSLEWLLDPDSSNEPVASESAIQFEGKTPLIHPLEIIDFFLSLDFKNLVLRPKHMLLVDTLEWPGQSFAIECTDDVIISNASLGEIVIFNNATIPTVGDIVAAMDRVEGSLRPIFAVLEEGHTINGIPTNLPTRNDPRTRATVAKMHQNGRGATIVGTAVERRTLLRR